MAIIQSGASPASNQQFVETNSGARSVLVKRGTQFAVAGTTGTIAAALAANSSVFAMRLDPGATVNAFIERIRLQFTTIVAFTVPITAGRRLELYRFSATGNPSGQTAIANAVRKKSTSATSEFDSANGGDMRISGTGAITVTGLTFETVPIKVLHLTHLGNAGNFVDALWEMADTESSPIQLEPGQGIAIRNPVAMDAAGTWQLGVNVDWFEASAI